MISLKAHNIVDYIAAAFLFLAPYLFGFDNIMEARTLFICGGIALAAYSLLTKYYYAAMRLIPVGVHMSLDIVMGGLILLAPYVLGYRAFLTSGQFALHAVLGVGVWGLVLFTKTRTEADKTPEERRDTTDSHFGRPSMPGV